MYNIRRQIKRFDDGEITCPFCGWEVDLNFSRQSHSAEEMCCHMQEENHGSIVFEGLSSSSETDALLA